MTDIDYAARVAKGVALLDEKRPGWERELDLETLDISDGNFCVTAQLYGGLWRNGMQALGLTDHNSGTYVSHGFNAEGEEHCSRACCAGSGDLPEGYSMEAAYTTLNAEWRRVITERLGAEAPA